ncbi:GcrA cell cycle regulator [Sinorhizobium medicae]|uniref:GcrA family cell cycle regulator n=1 Tax=Sinorhizobium medicae TaxID=110321 RepID=UPI000FD84A2D|nr:GcrA family cell cycle regulator [Sinorhizobium medicae]MDX0517178.1 GcrA cell cycle regulator [Sinorhizobium medicae]MDX0603778.1 GcrA cell cycle regulator [Sinorhizobium medicae]MDX0623048.1 GcrA cell cycle regulator [Sinorhizobium medicae]MDX0665939.1 GcrA cell cycle regulator [Sinorhizobium medicae]MDX0722565.1 GcrA cell cycle regulator [Sinorhizobium medicae]
MTIQHRTVDIEAAAKLWKDDLSASQIAKRFGVSRNVIVGLAFRNRGLFPWRGAVGRKTPSKRETAQAARTRKQAPELKSEPEIPPTAYDAERLQSAKLLHHLTAGECCWPLNTGGPYLFCAAETTGRYCRNHHARSLPKNEGKA